MSLLERTAGGGLLIYSVRKSKPIPLDLSLGAFSDLWPVGRFVLGTIHLRRPQNLLRMRTLFAFDSKTHDGYQGSLAFYFCFWGLRSTPHAIVICDGLLSAFFSLSLLAPHSKLIGRHLKSFQALHSDVDCTGRKP